MANVDSRTSRHPFFGLALGAFLGVLLLGVLYFGASRMLQQVNDINDLKTSVHEVQQQNAALRALNSEILSDNADLTALQPFHVRPVPSPSSNDPSHEPQPFSRQH